MLFYISLSDLLNFIHQHDSTGILTRDHITREGLIPPNTNDYDVGRSELQRDLPRFSGDQSGLKCGDKSIKTLNEFDAVCAQNDRNLNHNFATHYNQGLAMPIETTIGINLEPTLKQMSLSAPLSIKRQNNLETSVFSSKLVLTTIYIALIRPSSSVDNMLIIPGAIQCHTQITKQGGKIQGVFTNSALLYELLTSKSVMRINEFLHKLQNEIAQKLKLTPPFLPKDKKELEKLDPDTKDELEKLNAEYKEHSSPEIPLTLFYLQKKLREYNLTNNNTQFLPTQNDLKIQLNKFNNKDKNSESTRFKDALDYVISNTNDGFLLLLLQQLLQKYPATAPIPFRHFKPQKKPFMPAEALLASPCSIQDRQQLSNVIDEILTNEKKNKLFKHELQAIQLHLQSMTLSVAITMVFSEFVRKIANPEQQKNLNNLTYLQDAPTSGASLSPVL